MEASSRIRAGGIALAVAAAASLPSTARAAEQQAYAEALNYTTPVVVTREHDSVRFNNLDSLAEHDLDSDKPGLFDSPLVAGGESTRVRGVEKLPPGVYAFHCSLHSWMHGQLAVSKVGAGGDTPLRPPPNQSDRPDPLTLLPRAPVAPLGPGNWPSYGGDLANSRSGGPDGPAPAEVPNLGPVWSFKSADGDFTGTPAVARGTLVAGSFGGTVFALDAATGRRLWSRDLGEQINGSPAISGSRVFVPLATPNRPRLAALDLRNGKLLWRSVLDSQRDADLYGSPVVWRGTVYNGVSGYYGEAGDPNVAVRGSVVALDARTGARRWKTFIVPEKHDGGAVWTTPAIDTATGRLYVGTGNAYHQPAASTTDAVLALDARTGRIVDRYQATRRDAWNAGNLAGGPDYDFGASPQLIQGPKGRKLVGAGQKSGIYWALDRRTLVPVWSTLTGPGLPALGGIIGSTAYDRKRIYGPNTHAGEVWAIGRDGGYKWLSSDGDPAHFAPTSTANGVVYGSSTDGFLTAREAATGAVLAKLPLGSGSWGGVAIAGGSVFAVTGMQSAAGYIVAYRPRGGSDGSHSSAAGDRRPPRLRLGGRRRQRALARRGVVFAAWCSERCRLTISPRLRISGRRKSIRLRNASRDLVSGRRVRLKLRLSRRTRALIRRSLRRHGRAAVALSGRAVDRSGNVGKAHRGVRIGR